MNVQQQLQAENQQLRQRLAQLEAILTQRSVVVVNELIDGLNYLSMAAQAGDSNSRQLLGQLAQMLARAADAGTGLTVVRGNGGIPPVIQ